MQNIQMYAYIYINALYAYMCHMYVYTCKYDTGKCVSYVLYIHRYTHIIDMCMYIHVNMTHVLGRPRGMEWGGRREEGSGSGTHVYLWQIHFDIWQN